MRSLGLCAIVAALLLRYLYLHYLWRRQVEAEAQARFEKLQARIRPHFLFNSINTIANLTHTDPGLAEELLQDLADLFRAALGKSGERATLEEELELSRRYLHIEKQRLGERMEILWDVEELPGDAALPPLILQPLVENAVYHGIQPARRPGVIRIGGRYRRGRVNLSVRNSLPEDPPSGPPQRRQPHGHGQRTPTPGGHVPRQRPCRRSRASRATTRFGWFSLIPGGSGEDPDRRRRSPGAGTPAAAALRVGGDYVVAARLRTAFRPGCLRTLEIDLVLLDISMPGMDGLDAADRLAKLEPPPSVILVTAYPEHALEAFERRVDDYLVKPVRRERLQTALERARIPNRPQREALGQPVKPKPAPSQLMPATAAACRRCRSTRCIYLQAEHKYVTVRHARGTILVDESLKSLEEEYSDLFIRIHRNALVACRASKGWRKTRTAYPGPSARLRGALCPSAAGTCRS